MPDAMKTKYKFIHFETRGLVVACVSNKTGTLLGQVNPGPKRWRCCVFEAEPNAMFSKDCLTDIADFLRQCDERMA